jgi:CelD/BcsL family acetyltransferase involved in cellulose biosynthesis
MVTTLTPMLTEAVDTSNHTGEPLLGAQTEQAPTSARSPLHELTVARVTDIEAARADWTSLALEAGNVFGTWEWADVWLRHLAPGAELAVAIARRPSGQAAAILPLCVVRRSPFRLVRFIGTGPADQLGPVCVADEQGEVARALRRLVDQVLEGSGLFIGDRLWGEDAFVERLGAPVVRRVPSPVLPLRAASFEEFLSSRSRNFRSQVRRRERNLLRAGRLTYRLTRHAHELDRDMRTLLMLHAARWNGRQTNALHGARARFHLEFARVALANGWLRLWTLELDEQPLATYYGFRYAGIEFYYQMGRDPSHDRLHVGFVLLCHTIRCAFEDGMREYRFGLGGEAYKLRFAEKDPGLNTVAITSGVRGAMALSAIRAALLLPEDARRLAWRLGGRSPA